MMANCAWFSRNSLIFSPEPAEVMAESEIFCFGCNLTLVKVDKATPTG